MTANHINRSQARRQLANAYLRDASHAGLSLPVRCDAVFDAIYLLALSALDTSGDRFEHPNRDVLRAGAEEFSLTSAQLQLALGYLECRYGPERHLLIQDVLAQPATTYDALLSIAKHMGAQSGDGV